MNSNVRSRVWIASVLAGACLATAEALAAPWSFVGQVVKVADGDTVTMVDDTGTRVRVRLADIDAPESCKAPYSAGPETDFKLCRGKPGQPFSDVSKRSLVALAIGKQGTSTCREHDRWGRSVCRVVVNGVDLSVAQVGAGLAWYDDRFGRDNELARVAAAQQARGRGLFSDKHAVRPSEWRERCWRDGRC